MHAGLGVVHVIHIAHALRAVRGVAWAASAVGLTAGRAALRAHRGGFRPITRRENRMVFVVGSPRSGTTFGGSYSSFATWASSTGCAASSRTRRRATSSRVRCTPIRWRRRST